MATLNKKLLQGFLTLSIESRAEFVEKILASLKLGPDHIDALGKSEIAQRMDEVEKDPEEGLQILLKYVQKIKPKKVIAYTIDKENQNWD